MQHDRHGWRDHGLLRVRRSAQEEDGANGEKAGTDWEVEHGYEYRAFSIHLITSPVPAWTDSRRLTLAVSILSRVEPKAL